MKKITVVPGFVLVAYLMIGLVFAMLYCKTASAEPQPLNWVPNGKVIHASDQEYKIQTNQGSVVEVEVNRRGDLEEASGEVASKDDFVPGAGLLSLKQAVSRVRAEAGADVETVGEWSLKHGMLRGWQYTFKTHHNGQEREIVVSAKEGKIIKNKADD